MSRGYGWRFLDMGRRLERAVFGCSALRLVRDTVDEPSSALWDALLTITDTLVTYRRRYRSHIQEAPALDLLLFDEGSPRSVAYQFARLQEHVAGLPKKTTLPQRSAGERLVLEGLTMLRLVDLPHFLNGSQEKDAGEEFDRLLSRIGELLHAFSDAITTSYFRQTDLPQQLVDLQ